MKDTKTNFQKLVLPNGLTVLLYKMGDVRSVYAELDVRVGAVHEPIELQGISHFTEHASLLGTKKHKTKLDIARHAQSIGANFNGSTGRFATSYWVKLPYTNVSEGLDLLHEFVFAPELDKNRILNDKKVVLSELNDFRGNPERKFWHELWGKRFKMEGHPYSLNAIGKPEAIEMFDDAKVLAWRDRYYCPNNMILTITGNFEVEAIVKTVKELFGQQKPGELTKNPVFKDTEYSGFEIHTQSDSRAQIALGISFPAFGRNSSTRKDRMTLGILGYILSEGTGSRLFQRLRQKEGLVYDIGGGVTIYEYLGTIHFDSSASADKINDVIKVMVEEIKKLVANGITDTELDLAKKYGNYSTLLEFDTPVSIAHYISTQEFDLKEIWFPEKFIEESEEISKEEVNSMAKQIFDFSKANVGILGNVPGLTSSVIEEIFKN